MPEHDQRMEHLVDQLLKAGLSAGTVVHVAVYHDDWCAIFRGGRCNCQPATSKPITPQLN